MRPGVPAQVELSNLLHGPLPAPSTGPRAAPPAGAGGTPRPRPGAQCPGRCLHCPPGATLAAAGGLGLRSPGVFSLSAPATSLRCARGLDGRRIQQPTAWARAAFLGRGTLAMSGGQRWRPAGHRPPAGGVLQEVSRSVLRPQKSRNCERLPAAPSQEQLSCLLSSALIFDQLTTILRG